MKYIAVIVLAFSITLLVSPIMLITWSTDGYSDILDGLGEMCGID